MKKSFKMRWLNPSLSVHPSVLKTFGSKEYTPTLKDTFDSDRLKKKWQLLEQTRDISASIN